MSGQRVGVAAELGVEGVEHGQRAAARAAGGIGKRSCVSGRSDEYGFSQLPTR
jgi:hypothetical protein